MCKWSLTPHVSNKHIINVWCILFFTFNLTQLLNRSYNTAPNNCNVIFIILASCKWSTSNFFGLPTSLDSSQTRRTIRKAIHTQQNHAQINWDGNLKPGIGHKCDRIIGTPKRCNNYYASDICIISLTIMWNLYSTCHEKNDAYVKFD